MSHPRRLRPPGAGAPSGASAFPGHNMRTHVYVDGFNLYYGVLKKTPFKWLDLGGLFRAVLKPGYKVTKIKYFTALVSARPDDPHQPERQNVYLRALRRHCPEVEIFYGHFLSHTVRAPLADMSRGLRMVNIIKTEEKGSDVNLAVHLLNDAWLDAYDCAAVVSNDSDIAESMRLVKAGTGKTTGLITPGRRHPSRQLMQNADFHRRVKNSALRKNQLPSPVPGTNITKPVSW